VSTSACKINRKRSRFLSSGKSISIIYRPLRYAVQEERLGGITTWRGRQGRPLSSAHAEPSIGSRRAACSQPQPRLHTRARSRRLDRPPLNGRETRRKKVPAAARPIGDRNRVEDSRASAREQIVLSCKRTTFQFCHVSREWRDLASFPALESGRRHRRGGQA